MPIESQTPPAPNLLLHGNQTGCGGRQDAVWSKAVNLDFEARVPVPFSIFPSSYKEEDNQQEQQAPAYTTQTQTNEEQFYQAPQQLRPGREGQYSSSYQVVDESAAAPAAESHYPYRAPAPAPRYEEEVRYTREEERYRRPGVRREYLREDPYQTFAENTVEFDTTNRQDLYSSPIDVAERQYRTRFNPSFREEVYTYNDNKTTVDADFVRPQQYQSAPVSAPAVNDYNTVDPPYNRTETYHRRSSALIDDTVEPQDYAPRPIPKTKTDKMGYYDDDGRYHSFRQGASRFADRVDRVFRPEERVEIVDEYVESVPAPAPAPAPRRYIEERLPPNTVSIPCHHIRIGDILFLQGRPCQVIRISTSPATGQHRYLGVDLFTKKLHEESSFVSSPGPSVVVQTMLGPVFKQYRVLDLQEGSVVAMTESGDVKQSLPVIDQSNLWSRLGRAFESGRGSVRVLVLNDHGRELAVDMKVVHGVSL